MNTNGKTYSDIFYFPQLKMERFFYMFFVNHGNNKGSENGLHHSWRLNDVKTKHLLLVLLILSIDLVHPSVSVHHVTW